MRIVLDIQPAIDQKAGVGQYTWYLARYLPELVDDDEEVRLFFFDFRRRAGRVDDLPPGFPFRRCRWMPGRLAQASWKRFGFPPYRWFAGQADLYHFPNFIIPPGTPGRVVVTVHDIAFVRYPEFTEERNLRYLRTCIRSTLARADHVITDSEFSRGEILEHYGLPEERVSAVWLAVDDRFREPAPPETVAEYLGSKGLPPKYLLSVCTLEPRKNLIGLVKAYRLFRARNPDLDDIRLAIVGARGWKDDSIVEELQAPDLRDSVILVGYVGHRDLPLVYRGATAFVFPSLYEGFGMPPAEAMACGIPTACSNAASLPEVVGDAAVTFDPGDTEAMTDAMVRVVRDTALRERLSREGPQRVRRFDWRGTTRSTLDIYRRVLSGGGRS
jgi:glycosyltransferase involved in cell wall biosynthesis